MILSEIMPGSVKPDKTAFFPSDVNNSMPALKSSHTSFSDILENRASYAQGKSNIKSERHGYLTYREAAKRSTAITLSNSSASTRRKEITSLKDDPTEGQKKARQRNDNTSLFMYITAGMLGLDNSELKRLLNEAGISAESFVSMTNAEGNVSKLSELLGLDSEHKETLLNVIRLAAEISENSASLYTESAAAEAALADQEMITQLQTTDTLSRSGIQYDELNAGNNSEINAGNRVELIDSKSMNNIGTFADKLGIKLKESLSVLKSKLDADKSTLFEEAAMLVRLYLKELKSINPEESAVQQMDTVDAGQEDGMAIEAAEISHDAGPEEESKDMRKERHVKGDSELYRTAHLNEKPQLQDIQGIFAAIQPENTGFTEAVSAGEKTVSVYANPIAEHDEIISQVIEKAQVILTADKSEMVMELEPKSLGKLSLKVVTENNIVTAKFLAESHQVKQVLEANMQVLKDSLEKQGLSVQGFSVSVRQDSNRQADRRNHRSGNNVTGLARAAYRAEEAAGGIAYVFGGESTRNPYSINTSTINLTA